MFDVYESGFDVLSVCNIYFTIMRKNRQDKDFSPPRIPISQDLRQVRKISPNKSY
ncbi:hypothetical protein JCM18904_3178 [Vibrio sp. JCM 18904]|nr:hypothetical protein JCM18904_3178 [Vibrio sp. JCM 18904]